ncbi:tRNA sulfurtransferase [Litchfieldella qijiaojingensis]|uniref:tRNA sulfurtransferase n=1 Tax=Litchfieldella qijiaojingensis TaxID=980347 RepID=A0ABQ2Y9H3_9GAMM|nr:tRNA uracil 4-sulfurtransferase ThiI [Halomonas qijiaojingensis]GGX77098.1 tRNA sulfurtransferase [Halomonas qijiaojingensis]
MKYLLKLFPEITIKSRSVRKEMVRCLRANVRNTLYRYDAGVHVAGKWDALEVQPSTDLPADRLATIEAMMTRIPGIHEVLTIEDRQFHSFEDTTEQLLPLWVPYIAHKSFCVRVKRRGEHEFRSDDLERHLGAALVSAAPGARVDLEHPDVVVSLELKGKRLLLITQRRPGLGGYPLGTQGSALALISGGFDSPVAAYRMIRRGIKTHFLFFNLGGPAHEAGVREVTHHLWQRYSTSHHVDFISVPFEGVVNEILTKIPDGLMGVVLKRMMMRAADKIAAKGRIPALVTGDAIAQVSSQSLTNLSLIDSLAERPILRPLVASDKQDIIAEARRIGTAEFAERMPEYCGVTSRRPNTRARRDRVETAEAEFDFEVLDRAIDQASKTRVNKLIETAPVLAEVKVVDSPEALAAQPDCSVIDIRHPSERDEAPLRIPNKVELLEIPFYELQEEAKTLPSDRHYLLYCDQGVMSKMQALHLADQGLTNFGVYRGEEQEVAV